MRCEHCVTTDRPKNGDECPFLKIIEHRLKIQHDALSSRLTVAQLEKKLRDNDENNATEVSKAKLYGCVKI